MTINNVDLESVAGLAQACLDEPTTADTQWNATVVWNGGFRSESRVRDFDAVPSDEPFGLGGTNTAPNPVEQLLGALGNCLAVGYAANASAAGIAIDSLEIELNGDLDLHTFLGLKEGHAGYSSIQATVKLVSDASPEALEALHAKVTSTSPVGHTLARPIPVSVDLASTAASATL